MTLLHKGTLKPKTTAVLRTWYVFAGIFMDHNIPSTRGLLRGARASGGILGPKGFMFMKVP